MKELENIDLDHEDPIGVLKIIKRKLRLTTKDFANILDVPVVKITKLLAKSIRLTEDEAKKLATHFDIEIFYFGRWYRIGSDPNYYDDPLIKAKIISLTAYLRFEYEKLVLENENHYLIDVWKEHSGEWLNNHILLTEKFAGSVGGYSFDTKKEAKQKISHLKKLITILRVR